MVSSSFIREIAKQYAADALLFLSQDSESLTRFHRWLAERKDSPTDMMSEREVADLLQTYAPYMKGVL